ncbi:MAG: hypothetical protein AAF146_20180, partial [Bacteroidota bacterium]
MYSSKLVTTLKALRDHEMERLDQFLRSPYFNPEYATPELQGLWHYLRQGLHGPEEAYFGRDRVYGAVFGSDTMYKSKLEKLMSQLYGLVRRFLVFEQIQAGMTESRELLHLLDALAERRMGPQFNLVHKKLKTLSREQPADSSQYFYEYFSLEKKVIDFQMIDNNRRTDLQLPELHFHLDAYYLLQKLEMACQLLTRHVFIVPTDYGNRLHYLDLLIAELDDAHRQMPIIALYLGAYRLLKSLVEQDTEEYFEQFNELLDRHRSAISRQQESILQTLNRNYILHKYQKVSHDYLPQVFHTYRKHLEAGLLYRDGLILPSLFSNIVSLGLRQGEIKWVFRFIQEHRDRLLGLGDSDILVQYNLALYYFYT